MRKPHRGAGLCTRCRQPRRQPRKAPASRGSPWPCAPYIGMLPWGCRRLVMGVLVALCCKSDMPAGLTCPSWPRSCSYAQMPRLAPIMLICSDAPSGPEPDPGLKVMSRPGLKVMGRLPSDAAPGWRAMLEDVLWLKACDEKAPRSSRGQRAERGERDLQGRRGAARLLHQQNERSSEERNTALSATQP